MIKMKTRVAMVAVLLFFAILNGIEKDLKSVESNENLHAVIIIGMDDMPFWNDASAIYCTLKEAGYTDANIIVHYGSMNSSNGNDFDGPAVIDNHFDYPATKSDIRNTFENLEGTLEPDDQLFVYVGDHGLSSHGDSSILLSGGSELLYDYELEGYVRYIKCAQMIFIMAQCYSGGFVDNIMHFKSDPTINVECTNRVIQTSCSATEQGWMEYWLTGGNAGEFSYYWSAAVRQKYYTKWGWRTYESAPGEFPFTDFDNFEDHPSDYNSDLNEDGFIQMGEAFDYANNCDSYSIDDYYCNPYPYPITPTPRFETPQMESRIGFMEDLLSLSGICGRVKSTQSVTGNFMVNPSLIIDPEISLTLSDETKMYCSGSLSIEEDASITLLPGSELTIKPNCLLILKAGSELVIEQGANLIIDPDAIVEAETGAKITVRGGATLDLTNVTITGNSTWQGIIAEVGSTVTFSNTSISNAVLGLYAEASDVNIEYSSFTDCENGVSLVNCKNYTLNYNHFFGKIGSIGAGITLTHCGLPIIGNFVSNYGIGVKLVSSSLSLAKNTIKNNLNNGLFITGNGSKPTLVNSDTKDLTQKSLNNDIVDNGLNSIFYSQAQIFMRYSAGVYMTNGYNNVYSGEIGSMPTIPCIKGIIQLDPNEPVISQVNIAAEMNYWGYPSIDERNQASFFSFPYNPTTPVIGYFIDYDPYGLEPFTEEGPYPATNLSSNEPRSTESILLSNAMRLEQDDKYTPSIKLYEKVIEDYPDSEEYYVATARLPYVYEEAAEPLEQLFSTYEEALASEEITNKKFFKQMKVSTKIKNKKYDEAIALAEEMKAEATTDE